MMGSSEGILVIVCIVGKVLQQAAQAIRQNATSKFKAAAISKNTYYRRIRDKKEYVSWIQEDRLLAELAAAANPDGNATGDADQTTDSNDDAETEYLGFLKTT